MAYKTIKLCTRCENKFICASNRQLYCSPCRPLVRQEKNKLWQHDYYMKNQEEKLEGYSAYNKTEKGRAAQQLRDAVRSGKIERQPCEICSEPKAQGHHFDYSKPLEVRWLCPKHHREEHLFLPWQNELRRAGYTGGFLLGQLIEAFGDDFTSLVQRNVGQCWGAIGGGHYDKRGPTPEEAVAALWLALNKKL